MAALETDDVKVIGMSSVFYSLKLVLQWKIPLLLQQSPHFCFFPY